MQHDYWYNSQDIKSKISFKMAGMKCKYYLKIYEITSEMTKHLSMCKIQ